MIRSFDLNRQTDHKLQGYFFLKMIKLKSDENLVFAPLTENLLKLIKIYGSWNYIFESSGISMLSLIQTSIS